MRVCYAVTVALALMGLVYNHGSDAALLSFLFICVSASPLLLCSLGLPREGAVTMEHGGVLTGLSLLFLALSLLNLIVFAVNEGFGLSSLFDPQSLVALAAQSTFQRYEYEGGSGNPLLVGAMLINAYLWAGARRRVLLALLPALLPAALYTVLSTEKWPFYCSMSFFVTRVLFSRPAGSTRKLSGYGTVAAVGIVALPIALLSLALRAGAEDVTAAFDLAAGLTNVLFHYMFAQYEAFGLWLSAHYADCCTFGRYTFVGPASALGLTERLAGVFAENVTVNGLDTNIYTAWRYLTQDFSVGGPIVLVFVYAAAYRYCVLRGWVASRARF